MFYFSFDSNSPSTVKELQLFKRGFLVLLEEKIYHRNFLCCVIAVVLNLRPTGVVCFFLVVVRVSDKNIHNCFYILYFLIWNHFLS